MDMHFNERKQLGFDVDEQKSFIYRLVGGKHECMGRRSLISIISCRRC